ncbi:B9 domain-containing protein 1-like isoform X1 [Neodiprion virginianus]|uniref:B9 domain-containing protein 1 n=1 Tax=Neodiprion lecontei TaxID=441921 RepID=A0A6J0C470_NEOLC|nr:B9 domain-containing protein 1-like isoform X1 [Neodiprion lecontei]XP_046606783.1 B9 domain-containing protein 1-like isoform X1 [Neodiprion virginianus]
MSVEGEFFLSVTGSIEYANFYDIDNVYCKYGYHFGPDWSIVRGIEEGLTQMSKKSTDARQVAVWNFPLDIAFKSINPQGWPQLILSVYGLDCFGHDVVRGYGVCHLPLATGTHTKKVAVYVPQSSSILQQFIAWFSGRRPELIDPTILATGGGRELTRMISQGTITVRFNVSMKDFFKLGYSNGQQADR